MLTDALYLDARWASPFQSSLTQTGQFTTASGAPAEPEFMHGAGYRMVGFDRPYLMLVSDTATGQPLFLARVANPTAS